jgi:hypothetical protein
VRRQEFCQKNASAPETTTATRKLNVAAGRSSAQVDAGSGAFQSAPIGLPTRTGAAMKRSSMTCVRAGVLLALGGACAYADARSAVGALARAPRSIAVSNCSDSGPGSLRDAVANAVSGDLVDLSSLGCSTITLTSGQIEIPQDDLYLKYSGEGGTPPTIEANLSSRVLHHTGTGTLRLVGLTIRNGKYDNTNVYLPVHPRGGCIYSAGSVYLAGSTVSGCTARDTRGEDAAGGGIYASGALTLSHSTVSGNTSTSTARFADGGGAFAHGAIEVDYSSVSGNVASGLDYLNRGGGLCVFNAGTATSRIAHSTIDGNRADRGAGLIASGIGSSGAAIEIDESTISGNSANAYAAVYIDGPFTLNASTIAFNQSGSGPGVEIAASGYTVRFESSIVANNFGGGTEYDLGDRGYPLTIAGANNLVVAANGIALPADTIGTDPQLLPLADNGGPTRTHALAAGSPALDAGNDLAGGATDQRGAGFPRVFGAAADIGAFEQQTPSDTIFADGFE